MEFPGEKNQKQGIVQNESLQGIGDAIAADLPLPSGFDKTGVQLLCNICNIRHGASTRRPHSPSELETPLLRQPVDNWAEIPAFTS